MLVSVTNWYTLSDLEDVLYMKQTCMWHGLCSWTWIEPRWICNLISYLLILCFVYQWYLNDVVDMYDSSVCLWYKIAHKGCFHTSKVGVLVALYNALVCVCCTVHVGTLFSFLSNCIALLGVLLESFFTLEWHHSHPPVAPPPPKDFLPSHVTLCVMRPREGFTPVLVSQSSLIVRTKPRRCENALEVVVCCSFELDHIVYALYLSIYQQNLFQNK